MNRGQLKNVIHLHLGCEAKVPGGTIKISHALLETWDFEHHGIKPILRKTSSMSVNEFRNLFDESFSEDFSKLKIEKLDSLHELYRLISHYGDSTTIVDLGRMGFDVTNLIESGFAIDKNVK